MLETERTILSPLSVEKDLKSYHNLFLDAGVREYLSDCSEIEICKRRFNQEIQNYSRNGYGLLLIRDKDKNQVIGYCKIRESSRTSQNEMEVLCGILLDYRQQGFATEVINEILTWVFGNTDKDKIIGVVKPKNIPCIQLLGKLGFKKLESGINSAGEDDTEAVYFINKSN